MAKIKTQYPTPWKYFRGRRSVGSHPCCNEHYLSRFHGPLARDEEVVRRCVTDNTGGIPVCGGQNPAWAAAWAEYQAQQEGLK